MEHLLFKVSQKNYLNALEILSALSKDPLYEIKEGNTISIGGFFENIPSDLPDFLKDFEKQELQIDWTSQWENFCPNFIGNSFILDLSPYGLSKTINLEPGPGFGDLSHPTTRLCLKHMKDLVKDKIIVDFGCGSGILSVAAYAFFAKKVISIDIDKDAIRHTQLNLRQNHFDEKNVFEYLDPKVLQQNPVFIINMTFGDQKIALSTIERFEDSVIFLSSGILKSQSIEYIDWVKSKNLYIKTIDEEDDWVFLSNAYF